MSHYQHHLSGIFQGQPHALTAMAMLKNKGLAASQMYATPSDRQYLVTSISKQRHPLLSHVRLQGAMGPSIAACLALLAAWWLIGPMERVWLVNWIVTTLAILIASISLGVTLVAITGAMNKPLRSRAVKVSSAQWLERLTGQQILLSVHTYSVAETVIASEILQASVNHYQNIRIR